MWMVPRDSNGLTNRTAVPEVLSEALVRWYVGAGSDADHRASVILVVKAREAGQWIACSCQGPGAPPPLLSPSYLSLAETYYLRRLTSQKQHRPLHREKCPFYLPQAPHRFRATSHGQIYEVAGIKGLFNAHQLAPEKLAQEPADAEPDDRTRGVAIPRLAKLMWELIEAANLQTVPYLPAEGRQTHSIRDEFARIREIANTFSIAPGVALGRHLHFSAEHYNRTVVHARLREAAKDWPHGFAPQAFLLLEASEISKDTIVTGLGTVAVRNRIQHTGILHTGLKGPYLCLAVVGEHNPREGYLALRAYAQPIFNGNRFIPIHHACERTLIEKFVAMQFVFRRSRIFIALRRPLFDAITCEGPMRPDFIVQASDRRTGEEREWAVQMLNAGDPDYLALKQRERAYFETIGEVITLDAAAVERDELRAALTWMLDVHET